MMRWKINGPRLLLFAASFWWLLVTNPPIWSWGFWIALAAVSAEKHSDDRS